MTGLVRAAALLLLLGAAGNAAPPATPGPAPAKRPRVFLLLTIDTWRWDYLGAAGKTKVSTPNLNRLAAEGLYYPRAHSTAPLTAPAHASIVTGLYPFRHGVRDNGAFRLAPGVRTLATAFREKGFETGAFVSAAPLRSAIGLDRGFAVYDDGGQKRESRMTIAEPERRADRTIDKALGWVYGTDGRRDLFLWVHLYDPHFPYGSRQSATVKPPFDGYAGEVEFVDREAGRLITALSKGREVIAVITSDHGEGLSEHGEKTHGIVLYDTTLTVPLIVWPRPAGSAPWTSSRASLIDIAPTLCEWASLKCGEVDGRSLLRKEPGDRWLYAESLTPTLSLGIAPAYAYRRDPMIALLHGAQEVYDVVKDPDQRSDLAAGSGKPFLELARAELRKTQKRYPIEEELSRAQPAAPEEQRQLRSLGYIGGGVVRPRSWVVEDRRVLLKRLSSLDQARENLSVGQTAAALAGFESFLALYPNASAPRQEYGVALVGTGDTAKAARQLALALEQNPSDSVAALALGNLAIMKGDLASAERLFLRALTVEPDLEEALINLISLLVAQRRNADARPFALRFLEVAPDDPEAPKIRALFTP